MKPGLKNQRRRGFTMIEIMLVISIIGFLSALGIPAAIKAYANAQTAARERNIAAVEKAKGVLTLPDGIGVTGAMSLKADDPFDDLAVSNLCAALRIKSTDELTVGGIPIHVGDLATKAAYY